MSTLSSGWHALSTHSLVLPKVLADEAGITTWAYGAFMAQPPPAIAATRLAVRRALADLAPGALVLVACSGGADSMALAAATLFEARKADLRAGLITVNHQLQDGANAQADRVVHWARTVGMEPVLVRVVDVGTKGGPEAAARRARYAALREAAASHDAAAVLLGHTRDDQAETVLLALARGAGVKALSGMAPVREEFRRPLLELPREVVRAAALELPIWEDPHNTDPAYARSRLRALLPVLDETLGGGVVAGLARSARRLRQDSEYLDELSTVRFEALSEFRSVPGLPTSVETLTLDARALSVEPPALRTRVLHMWALRVGVTPAALTQRHVDALDALVTAWRGQGPVHVPGGIHVRRSEGYLFALSGS